MTVLLSMLVVMYIHSVMLGSVSLIESRLLIHGIVFQSHMCRNTETSYSQYVFGRSQVQISALETGYPE
jgi:hypothetical protein